MLCLALVVGCAGGAPPVNQAASCPDPEAAVPGFPNAQAIPERSMATSMNPGMNSSRTIYELATPTTDVIALYDRCLGASTGGVYALPSRQGTRSIAVAHGGRKTTLTVACERCY